MGLGDKASALALSERAIAANPIEKDAMRGPVVNRVPCTGGSANGRTRPCYRRLTEITLDPVRRSIRWQHTAYSGAAPARSDV